MLHWNGLWLATCVAVLLLVAVPVAAQTLYKYRGPDGEWIYTDRKPHNESDVEERALAVEGGPGGVSLTRHSENGRHTLLASNSLHAPVQLRLMARGRAPGGTHREWVLQPQSNVELMTVDGPASRTGEQRYMWIVGDPEAVHRPEQPYRAPFPAAVSHRISQAWPDTVAHNTPDSMHAVDIAMPIGSNVHAARGGIIIEVASTNYTNTTTSIGGDGAKANIVRILHDDGTFAIYAHLNWNSIRVRPGQRVARGEYIANSGNTGFSTGPHLHFVVIRNAGMRMVSMPVTFALPLDADQAPRSGELLTAH